MLKVMWLEHNLSHLVLDAPYITARAEPSLGDTISTIKFANPNMIFNEGDTKSALYGIEWQNNPITVWRNGEIVLNGIVTDGVVSRTDCTFEVQSCFSRAFKSYCKSTLYNTDPATAIFQLCRAAHITEDEIDTASFILAARTLRAEGISVNAIADKQYQTPLLDAINALLEMGCMRAWFDTKLHVVIMPYRPQGDPEMLLKIRSRDVLGDIQYGTEQRQVKEYSIGHIGDSYGAKPAEGTLTARYGDEYFQQNGMVRPLQTSLVETWAQSYGASSQWQLRDARAAHALGRLKLRQDRRRRTAALAIRDNGSIPLVIGSVYDIRPWPGYGWLTGYEKKQGTIDMYFEEALEYA
jgi:hypothetical protein